jgi:hypothetical protein
MNVLRWIFGFPLATAISIGLLYISTVYGIQGMDVSRMYFLSAFFRVIASIFCLAAWVFLTCFFIPFHKKIAGLVPVISTFVLITIIILQEIKSSRSINLMRSYLIPIAVIFLSFFIGYVVSYLVFKGKGWGRLKKGPAKELAELYPY